MDFWQEQVKTLLISLVVFIGALWIGIRLGFVKKLPESSKNLCILSWWDVLGCFAAFLVTMTGIAPLIFYFWLSYQRGELIGPSELQQLKHVEASMNLFAILLSAAAVALYVFLLPKSKKRVVFGLRGWKLSDLTIGAGSWLICYPLVASISQIAQIILHLFHLSEKTQDQVAVRQFKLAMEQPYMIPVFALLLIVIVPVIEEFLFRGFLQNRLKTVGGSVFSIILTSIIFSLFHFSTSQGWGNLELISSLFLLACFLGYLYERQQSIWAPIVLHGTFNAVSVLAIISSS